MRVIGEHLGDCACMICKQGQENQGIKRKFEQREQEEINSPLASLEAEAQSAELAPESAQAAADITGATTPVTDRSAAAFTTQQASAGVTAERELSQHGLKE